MSIACASILAKVTRDHVMMEWDQRYPQYQFAKHKGYGTKLHMDLIRRYGPCELHRQSFLKKILGAGAPELPGPIDEKEKQRQPPIWRKEAFAF